MAQLERILYINRMIEQQGGVATAAVVATFSPEFSTGLYD